MAFVAPVPVHAGRQTPVLRASTTTQLRNATATPSVMTPRMGYGDYSYLTDKTKGHVNQYYVDKLRVAADFVKGGPATEADAKLGRNMKGGVAVPQNGIPQELGEALAPFDSTVAPDPRIAESEGVVYPWDPNYVDPKFAPDTYADLDDAETSGNAFATFRESMHSSRGASLSAQDFGAVARVQRIKEGLDVDYLCSLDGQLDAAYARLQKLDDPAVLSPTGVPQTEIPGMPFLRSVGAMDLIPKPNDSIAFWKDEQILPLELPYKRPSGSDTPDLPYNTSATVDSLKEAQEARKGLMPAERED